LEPVGPETWSAILSEISARLEEGTYRAWFSRLRALGVDGDVLVVGVPNRFFREWLARRYAALVADVAGEVLGGAVAVEFRTCGELLREFRGDQEGDERRRRIDARDASKAPPSVPEFLSEIGWDASSAGDEQRLYSHGDRLLHEAIRQYREAEVGPTTILRPSSYFVGILRRLARQRARGRANVTDARDQLRLPENSL
jgi:chromosomal replication initiation ATPase DnaA